MLTKGNITLNIKRLMIDEFDLASVEDIPDDAKLGSIRQWDSLAHVSLLMKLQDTFGIEFVPEEIAATLSLHDLVTTVIMKRGGRIKPVVSRSAVSTNAWEKLFSRLWMEDRLREDDTIYIHSRAQAVLEVIKGSLSDAIEFLKSAGGGNRTLVFPAFPFTSGTYNAYITARPRFSVATTPAVTGLLPEMILKEANVRRSAHPILSECAVGPKAEWITCDAHLDPHPFHTDSTYARLLESDAAMIGLGVDINTNAIIHMVDEMFRGSYPFELFSRDPLKFEIELSDGKIIKKDFFAYSPDMVRRIKPRNLRPFFADHPQILKEIEIEGVWFYRLRMGPFLAKCAEIARRYLAEGNLPPWFQ